MARGDYDEHYSRAKKEVTQGTNRKDLYLLAGKYEDRGDREAAKGIRDATVGRSRRR